MNIAIIVEGETEEVFLPVLRDFLSSRLEGKMPRLIPKICQGRVPKGDKLKRDVQALLSGKVPEVDHVIALTDVYTGANDFHDAEDARRKMRGWVGENPNFHPHAAQYDFEAWLLPFWPTILQLAKHNAKPPGRPEAVNHTRPPSHRIREVFRLGKRRDYVKTRDAKKILEGKDLSIAAEACPELKAFINTILTLCDGDPL